MHLPAIRCHQGGGRRRRAWAFRSSQSLPRRARVVCGAFVFATMTEQLGEEVVGLRQIGEQAQPSASEIDSPRKTSASEPRPGVAEPHRQAEHREHPSPHQSPGSSREAVPGQLCRPIEVPHLELAPRAVKGGDGPGVVELCQPLEVVARRAGISRQQVGIAAPHAGVVPCADLPRARSSPGHAPRRTGRPLARPRRSGPWPSPLRRSHQQIVLQARASSRAFCAEERAEPRRPASQRAADSL